MCGKAQTPNSRDPTGIANDACMVDEDRIFIAGGDATIRIYNWKQATMPTV